MRNIDLTEAEAIDILKRFQDVQKSYPVDSPKWISASKTINALCAMMASAKEVK